MPVKCKPQNEGRPYLDETLKLKIALAAITTTLIAACITSGSVGLSQSTALQWQTQYPENQYLTAIGEGQTTSKAKQSAIAEMARIFDSRITSEITSEIQSIINHQGKEQVQKNNRKNFRVVSNVHLTGVEIAKTTYGNDRYFALAILNKVQAKAEWRQRLSTLEKLLQAQGKTLKMPLSPLQLFQTHNRIQHLWTQKKTVLTRLRVVSGNDSVPISNDIAKTNQYLASARQKLTIYIQVQGRNEKYRQHAKIAIQKKLSQSGMAIAQSQNIAQVRIIGSITVAPIALSGNQFEFARAHGTFSIIDGKTEKIVAKISEDVKVGHLKYPEAAAKAADKLMKISADKIAAYFLN